MPYYQDHGIIIEIHKRVNLGFSTNAYFNMLILHE